MARAIITSTAALLKKLVELERSEFVWHRLVDRKLKARRISEEEHGLIVSARDYRFLFCFAVMDSAEAWHSHLNESVMLGRAGG